MKPIRIISPDFQLLGELDKYESALPTHRFHGIGEVEIRINRHMEHVDKLLEGNLLIFGARPGQTRLNKVFIIRHREIELNESGKASENWLIKGLALKSVVSQRITMPPAHTAYDNKQGTAEEVMKHYVNMNAVNPVDPDRKIHELIIADNLNRGEVISRQSRFKNLAEELAEISIVTGLGWDVFLDIQLKKWVFDVIESRNVTTDQAVNPPVIFSPQFESIQSLQYVESKLNYKNMAYVAGQGEGTARRVIKIGADTGLNRHEIFIDARDIEETVEVEVTGPGGEKSTQTQPRPEADIIRDLNNRGNQQLQELMQEIYLEGQILSNSPFKYEKHYDLGDVVTLQNRDWGVTLNARLTEIKEVYEVGGYRVEAVFGNNRPTLIQKVKQELSQMSGEVRR